MTNDSPYRASSPSAPDHDDLWCPASHRRRGFLRSVRDWDASLSGLVPKAQRDQVTPTKHGICPTCREVVPLHKGRYALHPRKFPCACLCGKASFGRPDEGWLYIAEDEWACPDCAKKAHLRR